MGPGIGRGRTLRVSGEAEVRRLAHGRRGLVTSPRMDVLPWRSDRPLDAERVARVVAAQFPDLAPARAEFLDEGWDSDAYAVNGTWVFRFPKRADIQASHDVERALLPHLGPRLPIQVPDPTKFGQPCEEFPYRFVGHRCIEGVPASRFPVDRVDQRTCAGQLGPFLSRLHSFPAEEAARLGVPAPPLAMRLAAPRERLRALWPQIVPGLDADLARRGAAFLEEPAVPLYAGPLRLCNTDLRDGHVLLAEDGSRIVGIIDWGDACLFDPAVDFAGIWGWLGESFVRRVLDGYEGEVDGGFLERARPRCAFVCLYCVWHGVLAKREDFLASGVRGLHHALTSARA